MNLVRNNLSYLVLFFCAFCLTITACVNSNVNPSAVSSIETIEFDLPLEEELDEEGIVSQAINHRLNSNAYSSVLTYESVKFKGRVNCEIRDAVQYCEEQLQTNTNGLLSSRGIIFQERRWINRGSNSDLWEYVPESGWNSAYSGMLNLTFITHVVGISKKSINAVEFYEIQFEYDPYLILQAVVLAESIPEDMIENATMVDARGSLLISAQTNWLHAETFEFSLQGEEPLAFSGKIEFAENSEAVDFPLPFGERLFRESEDFLSIFNTGDFDQAYDKFSLDGQKEITLGMLRGIAEWGVNVLKFDTLTITQAGELDDEEGPTNFFYLLTLTGQKEGVVLANYQFIFEEESPNNWKIRRFDIFLPEDGADL